MDTEVRVETRSYAVYWVMDNKGARHLYHDRLAAQMAEERYAREAKELESVANNVPQRTV